ncbi:hypothetical protein O6P43_002435 [Quillaja saponaria]|uniref:Uncharacterized protein n=1 Tax=Quillaja saponaria TaxID=32244 RepID=A0AAD7QCJ5_QUISA|nr:hypothetical protein O6P43_002435 [Quillaja saponaria]
MAAVEFEVRSIIFLESSFLPGISSFLLGNTSRIINNFSDTKDENESDYDIDNFINNYDEGFEKFFEDSAFEINIINDNNKRKSLVQNENMEF